MKHCSLDILEAKAVSLQAFDWDSINTEAIDTAIKEAQEAGLQVVRLGKDGKGAFTTTPTTKKSKPSLNRLRINEIGALIHHRHCGPCDTDDAIVYLEAALPYLRAEKVPVVKWIEWATPGLLDDPTFDIRTVQTIEEQYYPFHRHLENAIRRGRAITMSPPIELPESKVRFHSADDLGKLLRLTPEERETLRINAIGAVGISKTKRKKARNVKKATSEKNRRKAKGATPHEESKSATEPWIKDGFNCRRTWERHGMKPREPKPETRGRKPKDKLKEMKPTA